MDDKSFNIRVPKRWVRVALIVGATALIVAPLTAIASHSFTDVPDSNTFHEDIAWLADADVTRGCNPPDNTEFCPDDDVTRGQMSAFMRRFSQYIGAEDGTPAQADNATTADSATTAEELDGFGPTDFLGAQVTSRFSEQAVPDASQASAVASCETGEVLIGGGGALSLFVSDVFLLSSRPVPLTDGATPTAWQASAINPGGGTASIDVRAWAVCASFPDAASSASPDHEVAEPETDQP